MRDAILSTVPQVPAKPPHLEHSFVSNGANMSVRLSWHTPRSDIPITDYRVEWGKLGEGEGKPLPENTLTKVLPKVRDDSTSVFSFVKDWTIHEKFDSFLSPKNGLFK